MYIFERAKFKCHKTIGHSVVFITVYTMYLSFLEDKGFAINPAICLQFSINFVITVGQHLQWAI